jgi:hypothetical protein
MREFRGCQFGVRLAHRGKDDPHVCVQLLTEDDGQWIKTGERFSSFWIDDLIEQLQAAKSAMQSLPRSQFGHEFSTESK